MFFHLVFCLLSWLGDFHYSIFHITNLSPALFILVCTALSSVCISANEFSSFSWLFLLFSSSFLREFALLFISSLNSFSVFTISLLNSKSVRLQRSVSLLTALGELLHLACVFLFRGGGERPVAGQGRWCWLAFFEAAGHFPRVGKACRVTPQQRVLPECGWG